MACNNVDFWPNLESSLHDCVEEDPTRSRGLQTNATLDLGPVSRLDSSFQPRRQPCSPSTIYATDYPSYTTPAEEDEQVSSRTDSQSPPTIPLKKISGNPARRRAQNRAAQRAFRERTRNHTRDLEQDLEKITADYRSLHTSHLGLLAAYGRLVKVLEIFASQGKQQNPVNDAQDDPSINTNILLNQEFLSQLALQGVR